jgi:hypothetical protein
MAEDIQFCHTVLYEAWHNINASIFTPKICPSQQKYHQNLNICLYVGAWICLVLKWNMDSKCSQLVSVNRNCRMEEEEEEKQGETPSLDVCVALI